MESVCKSNFNWHDDMPWQFIWHVSILTLSVFVQIWHTITFSDQYANPALMGRLTFLNKLIDIISPLPSSIGPSRFCLTSKLQIPVAEGAALFCQPSTLTYTDKCFYDFHSLFDISIVSHLKSMLGLCNHVTGSSQSQGDR